MDKNELLPLILFDINGEKILKTHSTHTNCFYVYSYQNFDIKILSSIGEDGKETKISPVIYSVKQLYDNNNQPYLDTQSSNEFVGKQNFGYTIVLPENLSVVTIECVSIDNVVSTYSITCIWENIKTDSNTHYDDLLVNYKLPTFEELELAVFNDANNKRDLIARLLLDFRHIVSHKGTATSIEKFFNFLGLNQEHLRICDEYFVNGLLENSTITPNKERDVKSGNYHVIYDNFITPPEHNKYDSDNLPIREFAYEDLDAFFHSLTHAISLANTYFTCEEQDIVYFGMCFNSNISSKYGVTSTFNMIFNQDLLYFRRNIDIDIVNWESFDSSRFVVENKVQHINSLNCSSVIYSTQNPSLNKELFFIDEEIFDMSDVTDINSTVEKVFGIINHLHIVANNLFVEVKITPANNQLASIVYPKVLLTEPCELKYFTKIWGLHEIRINVWDEYNNKETYVYNINVALSIANIDFEVYTSNVLMDLKVNSISTATDSPIVLTNMMSPENFILSLSDVPENLSNYYNITPVGITKWLSTTSQYILPAFNRNLRVIDMTETIPLKFADTWINMWTWVYDDNYDLKLRIFDGNSCSIKLIPYWKINEYYPLLDTIFVTVLDIITDQSAPEIKTPYYMLMTTQMGLDINTLFDFVLVEKNDGTLIALNENKEDYNSEYINSHEFTNKKLCVNYDFPLFTRPSELVPDFSHYVSPSNYTIEVEGITYPMVETIYPRLINKECLESDSNLRLGDIIYAQVNENYVSNETDIKWRIYNSFTGECLYTVENEYALKYRVVDNTCFTIECEMLIFGQKYIIRKDSILSAFKPTM